MPVRVSHAQRLAHADAHEIADIQPPPCGIVNLLRGLFSHQNADRNAEQNSPGVALGGRVSISQWVEHASSGALQPGILQPPHRLRTLLSLRRGVLHLIPRRHLLHVLSHGPVCYDHGQLVPRRVHELLHRRGLYCP